MTTSPWINDDSDEPVVFAGRYDLGDMDGPTIREGLPRSLAWRNPAHWVIADPLAFPYEQLSSRQWDAPMDIILPLDLVTTTLVSILHKPLLSRITAYDTIAAPAAAWRQLRSEYTWAEGQWRDAAEQSGDTARQLLSEARAVARDAAGSADPPHRARADQLRTRDNKARWRVESAVVTPMLRAGLGRHVSSAKVRAVDLSEGIGTYLPALDPLTNDVVAVRTNKHTAEQVGIDHPEVEVLLAEDPIKVQLSPESVDVVFATAAPPRPALRCNAAHPDTTLEFSSRWGLLCGRLPHRRPVRTPTRPIHGPVVRHRRCEHHPRSRGIDPGSRIRTNRTNRNAVHQDRSDHTMVSRTVIVLANDVTPGSGLPVAAPGLRAFGMAQGLRALGMDVTTVVPERVIDELWQGSIPPPVQPGTVILNGGALQQFIQANAPATVIMTNSNQVAFLDRADGVRYILDFFAPKMLERAHQFGDQARSDLMRSLRKRKLRTLSLVDGVAVNGSKKVPYVLDWLDQADRTPHSVPTVVANMAMPAFAHRGSERSGPIRLAIAGYLQGWSMPGEWMNVLRDQLTGNGALTLDLLLPTHWGQHTDELRSDSIDALLRLDNVTAQPVMRLSDFQEFMASVDVAIDLFDWTQEREYAMVTRTVVALACGVPVIHPPFTEVSPFIEKYDAGWLLAASDLEQIANTLDHLDRDEIETKSANAHQLWDDVFRPESATEPLVELIDQVWREP